jgi:hypothetical protein
MISNYSVIKSIAAIFLIVLGNVTFGQTISKGEVKLLSSVDFYKSGHKNSGIILDREVYTYSIDGKVIKSDENGVVIEEISIKKPFRKKSGVTVSGNIYKDGENGSFIIYDLGGAGGNVWNKSSNGFDNDAYLIAQKYTTEWKPVGNPVSLMATSFQDQSKGYSAGIFFNEDESKFAVIQSVATKVTSAFVMSLQTLPVKITVFNRKLNKITEVDLTESILNNKKKSGNLFRVRDVCFAQNKISVLLAFSGYRTKQVDEVAEQLTYNLDSKKIESKKLQLSSKSKGEKIHYARFLPENHDKILLFIKDFNSKFPFATASTIRLIDISAGTAKKVSEWKQDKSKIKATESNALCINDIDGKSNMGFYKTSSGKYVLVANRDYMYCSCDKKGNKKWQHFLLLSIDLKNQINVSILPLSKQKKYSEALPFAFGFKNDKILINSNFSLNYYKKGNKDMLPKTKEIGVNSMLEIDEFLKYTFYEL